MYQVRGGTIIWSGKMTMWANPNSPRWGTKIKAVGHARRTSGSAAGQWKQGDIMFFREADAMKFAPGTVIIDIEHNAGSKYDGKYPHFSTRSWYSQIGDTSWKSGNYNVWQVRESQIIWSGKMTMWANPNSPTHGTKNKLIGHARRTSGSAEDQWKKGDIMFARESDALKAISSTYGLTVARKLATSDVDVTGKLTAFSDVEIHGRLIVNGKQLKRRQLTDDQDTLLQQLMDKVAALEAKNADLERRLADAGM